MILHCFSATAERAEEAAERGWHVSFAGNVTYPKSEELRVAASLIPDRQLLVETDSPFLAPQVGQGQVERPGERHPHRRGRCRGARDRLRATRRDRLRERCEAVRLVRLGQNFLADPNLLEAIVTDAALDPEDVVLEVGGGEGALTERLAGRVARLHVIELDESLREPLGRIADAHPAVEIVWADAMRFDLGSLDPAPTAMVANLPYSVATPLILRTIAELPTLGRWTVMVQREIAERLRARPGSRSYGSPSVHRPVELRGADAAGGRPGRVQPAAAGRLGGPGAAAPGSRLISPAVRAADPGRVRPSAQGAAEVARAGRPASRGRGRAAGAAGAAAALARRSGTAAGRRSAQLGLPDGIRAEMLTPEQHLALAEAIAWSRREPRRARRS